MQELARRISTSDSASFPYDAVVEEFHRVGKHFVAKELLEALDGFRATLPDEPGPTVGAGSLRPFLDAALDKWDGRYDYQTYLALGVLPMPAAGDRDEDVPGAEVRRDRLVVALIADALRFELAVADGRTDLLPRMRPDPPTTAKRHRLGLRATLPAVRRLCLGGAVTAADPAGAARELCAAVETSLSPEEHRMLRLSMLPVYVAHDEYMFLRVLQSFEATFALLAVQIRAAAGALLAGAAGAAVRRLSAAEDVLQESAPLFSLLATMRVESFRTFRNYTEGASAIQSRNYKTVESLCRLPDQPRLDSPAYGAVPEVQQRVLAGQLTLDEVFGFASTAGHLGAAEIDDVERAMRRFAATLLHWRQTHYRLAVRMLGDLTGTGYTQGVPYLEQVRTIPVFRHVDVAWRGGTGGPPAERRAPGDTETPPRRDDVHPYAEDSDERT